MTPLFVFKNSLPSSSQDLNRCNYWMWGVIKAGPDAVTHNSVDYLKDVMNSVFRSNKVNRWSCVSSRDHTEKVVTASGAFIV